MAVAVVVEPERVEQLESGVGALDLGDRNGAVQRHDLRRGELLELLVEELDLLPVARLAISEKPNVS